MRNTKEELLKSYATKNPQPFIQFDCFVGVTEGDDMVNPDIDGDSLFSATTYELMTGNYGVRVLVRPDINKKTLVRALSKIITWVLRQDETDDVLLDAKRKLKRQKYLSTENSDQDEVAGEIPF